MLSRNREKIVALFIGILSFLGISVTHAALTDSGQVAANIPLTTALTAATYPSRVSGGTPIAISNGTGATDQLVVDDIIITDNSIAGWTLSVVTTNGSGGQAKLLNATDSSTIDYSVEIGSVAGTLATGLTLDPVVGAALTFSGVTATISPTGTASTETSAYQFDLLMTIANGATTGKLAGDYVDTLSLTLASDD